MGGFVLQRLLGVVGVMLGMSVLIFGIVHLLPGNVAYAILGEYATPAAVAALEAKLGLNDPLALQYWHWLSGMLRGDFGDSVVMSRPAAALIGEALGRSALLAGARAGAGGVRRRGARAACRHAQGEPADHVLTLGQFVLIAIPEFFWAIVAVLLVRLRAALAAGDRLRADGRGGDARAGRPTSSCR